MMAPKIGNKISPFSPPLNEESIAGVAMGDGSENGNGIPKTDSLTSDENPLEPEKKSGARYLAVKPELVKGGGSSLLMSHMSRSRRQNGGGGAGHYKF